MTRARALSASNRTTRCRRAWLGGWSGLASSRTAGEKSELLLCRRAALLFPDALDQEPPAVALLERVVVAADGGDMNVDVCLHHHHPGGGVTRGISVDNNYIVGVAVVAPQARGIVAQG